MPTINQLVKRGRKERIRNAHRVAYMVWRGPIQKSWAVLHYCGEPKCCNPEHLYLTQQPLQLGYQPFDMPELR